MDFSASSPDEGLRLERPGSMASEAQWHVKTGGGGCFEVGGMWGERLLWARFSGGEMDGGHGGQGYFVRCHDCVYVAV